MAKKIEPISDNPDKEAVDMSHIEEMMGPVPEVNHATEVLPKPSKKGKQDTPDVADSIREVNESIKAEMPGLGDASIAKVEDQDEAKLPKLTPADTPTAPEVDGAPTVDEPVEKPAPKPKKEPKEEPKEEPEVETPATTDDELTTARKALDPAAKKAHDEDADDPGLEKAVDDIVASETDELLAMEDEKNAEASSRKPKKDRGPGWRDRLSDFFHQPKMKWYILGAVVAGLIVLAALPWTRYFILNTAGVRVSANVTVIDQSTLQPIKNVKVSFGSQSATTGSDGKADVTGIKQGPTTMTIQKTAFATVTQKVTLGWGSNPKGQFTLTPTGSQYTFMVTDFLSGKAIGTAAANSGDGDAEADDKGKIVLTLAPKSDTANITVKITADGYRDENINLTANNKNTQNIKMVPARKDVFVSKRSGKYDVYTVDVDGKNPQKIVAGTGLERDDIALVNHSSDPLSALADTRENVRNSDGYLLTTLYVVDQKSGDLTKVDQSERIQIIGWTADDHLVYVKVAAGTSGNNPKRQRLISYNTKKTGDLKELASSNSFNDILMINDKVYFAPSSSFQPQGTAGLYRIAADGTSKVTIFNQEVYNIFRTEYDTLYLSVGSDWYTHKISTDTAQKATSAPAIQASHLYVDNSTSSSSLWVDQRDGQGVLINHDVKANKDTALITKTGLKNPVEWLTGTYIVYRVSDGHETADYVLNTQGGTPQKVTDVTDAASVSSWYYY